MNPPPRRSAMTDHDLIIWVIARLVATFHEHPNLDYIHRLRRIAIKLKKLDSAQSE